MEETDKQVQAFWNDENRRIYEEAMELVMKRICAIDDDFAQKNGSHIIRFTEKRLKNEESIKNKRSRKAKKYQSGSIQECLNDLAGVRVICFDKKQVYYMVNEVRQIPEFEILKEKDYIAKPKDNGYQSYHVILKVCDVKVELQLRTILMDAWSSLETILVYKKDREIPEKLKNNIQKFSKWSRKMDRLVEEMLEK